MSAGRGSLLVTVGYESLGQELRSGLIWLQLVRPYPFSLSFDWAKACSTRWRRERAVALAAQRWAGAMKEASTYEGPLPATQFPTSYSLTLSSCSNSRGTVSITRLPISRDKYTVGTE